jgi:diguanylate cyclase (GGDEF)-like protein/PAS domain S-box-containing protein
MSQKARLEVNADNMLAERVRLLYLNLPASLSISTLLALILICVQAETTSPKHLFAWSAMIATVFLGRAVLFVAWKRNARTSDKHQAGRWLLWFRIGVIAAGTVWGMGGVLFASGDAEHSMYTLLTLAGLSAGGATTLAVDRASVGSFLFLVLVPQIVSFVIQGNSVSLGIGAMTALFILFLMVSASQLSLQLQENFHLRFKATENEWRLRQMLESCPIATGITDAVGNRVVFANSSYNTLIGSTSEQVIGIDPTRYYADPEIFAEFREQVLQGTNVTDRMIELRSPGDSAWIKWVLASYFQIDYQNKTAILGWFYDITDHKLKGDRVEHLAYHDPLTGLPNRSRLIDCLKRALAHADRNSSKLALMFIDLDKFKPVNDLYGHPVGDLLLQSVAERIGDCLRKSDSVARIGGDEFVVVAPDINTEASAVEVAQKLCEALNQRFDIEGLVLHISCSIGIALYPDQAGEAQSLIKRADAAMYYAKAEGKNCVRVYRPQMREHLRTLV